MWDISCRAGTFSFRLRELSFYCITRVWSSETSKSPKHCCKNHPQKRRELNIMSKKKLHWLPISLRIKYKVLPMLYKSLHGLSPHYIRAMVEFHTPERTGLRSDIFQLLKVPNLKRKTFAARSYSVAALMWWNELPNSIKMAGNIDIFKTKLKTYFFDLF